MSSPTENAPSAFATDGTMAAAPEKYTPSDGRPLTPYEREILDILQEECAEVIVAISKVKRFGVGNTNPSTFEINTTELALELGDMRYMAHLAEQLHIVDRVIVEEGMLRKKRRLATFLQNAAPERAPK